MHTPSRRFTVLLVAVIGVALLARMSPQAANGKAPPSIDDMVGRWELKESHTEYNLSTGEKNNGKDENSWEITKVDGTTLNMHKEGSDPGEPDILAHYQNGILLAARADSDTLASEALTILAVVSGSGGKLKAKGDFITRDLPGDHAEKGKLTLKRISALGE